MMRPERFAAAYGLDWIAGDPAWFPHPVRWIGAAIATGERWLRRPSAPNVEMAQGALLTLAVVSSCWLTARAASRIGGARVEILLAWTTLATRNLLDESLAVIRAVEDRNLELARNGLARIVGRDTAPLDEPEILRAVIETLAEGLCDGVVAPLFYLALGGVPVAFAYKAINTLDSMIGHREPPYLYFGRVAARLDDAANFVPARVAACAIFGAAFFLNLDFRHAWYTFRRDGGRHPSPNAGQTEAALAGALGVQLGGVNYYQGLPSPKPPLGAGGRRATVSDARAALRIVAVASLAVFAIAWIVLRRRGR
jgi:adenosylcobinamide-phosphate synthase